MAELIEALEQLSLEVRNQSLIDGNNINGKYISQNHNNINNHQQHHQPKILTNQLEDFDNSIATLFSQITDLDLSQTQQQNLKLIDAAASRRAKYITYSPYNRALHFFETSQEEDSDSSSLRSSSGYATTTSSSSASSHCNSSTSNCVTATQNNHDNNNRQPMNPLVRDLLKKDLNTITGTVRKIGQILAIGSEIESIYKQLFARLAPQLTISTQYPAQNCTATTSATSQQYLSSSPLLAGIDLDRTRALCESFLELFASEQHIGDLPTMIHYNNYCHRLLNLLQTISCGGGGISLPSNYPEQPKAIDALEAEDVEFLNENEEWDESTTSGGSMQTTIWMDNKLYIDQRPG